jgi:hypothetical protein
MTLDDLKATLSSMPRGQAVHVPHEMYELLFPPGEPDENARARG